MAFHFTNSISKELEEFKPINDGRVRIYSCGPTVYNYAHIGNFRSYIFADLLGRALRLGGFETIHAMNITDVDDKTIKATLQNNPDPTIEDLKNYTSIYKDAFFDDIDTLGIEEMNVNPVATEPIDQI